MANKDKMIKNGEVIIENPRKAKMGTGRPRAHSVTIDTVTGLRPISIPLLDSATTTRRPRPLPTRPQLGRARLLMPEQVGSITRAEISRRSLPGLKTMPAIRRERPRRGKLGDQIPKREPVAAVEKGYVRLRLEAEDGVIRVVGIKHVEGDLTQSKKVRSGLVYEVVRRGKRVAMGQIPDSGQRRSFPHPDPKPGQEGHAIQDIPVVRFTARIPSAEFSTARVKQLDVSLLRVKDVVRQDIIDVVPLRQQLSHELRNVASMPRIREDALPRSVAKQLRAVLRR